MTTDDLSTPLGQGKIRNRRKALRIPWKPIIAVLLALPVAVFAGVAMFSNDPFGGEPMATAPATIAGDAAAAPTPPAAPGGPPAGAPPVQTAAPATPPGTKTVTIIDGGTGARRDVQIPATPDGGQGGGQGGGQAGQPAANDQRLTETSRHGPLPRIAQDGTRPSDAFARPVKPANGKGNGPRVAIVVGGLGIGANTTADAMRKLPGPVTLAFAPYGGDLERQVARARETEHEVMLQVPMEPFDYPDNDPGPHTLLTSIDTAQNIDRLHWLMSRFQGYVGIINHMGGRFSASEQGMAPVLREAATRGLIYLDDGSSARSLAGQIAGANNLAFAKADLIIDQVPTPADIDRALGRLETIARTRGTAVGFAGALPVSVDRISRWIKAAESRGIQLVPITAVVARAKSS
ncbi:MAG: divergent polysaccharide deacetylase family protein [Xanthobacteraceae bacterium]|nr:divergent polysaccharide deacetylase family protein [Xanthobacteraceae bacterium]